MVTIAITNGMQYQVNWQGGMNVQTAIEVAFNAAGPGTFTYALQYYGTAYGYLISMINETYETFNSKEAPYFYWEFLLNGKASTTGIDNTILNDGDVVTFALNFYNAAAPAESLMHVKY